MYNTRDDNGVRSIETTLDDDLAPFCAHLKAHRIVHRVYERQGRQVLEVLSDAGWARARADYSAWREGRLILAHPSPRRSGGAWANLVTPVWRYPGLIALTLITLALYPVTWPSIDSDGSVTWLRVFTIVDFVPSEKGSPVAVLGEALANGEIWRLLTPIFLHFSPMHLAFNLAVVLGFGRRIEAGAGSLHLLLAVVLIGIGSNLVQYVWSANGLFGGLSGVAYGLVAYVVVRGRVRPDLAVWQTHPSLIVSLVVVLALMTTGFTEMFGLHIANAAHWSGLIFGALIGAVASWRRHA